MMFGRAVANLGRMLQLLKSLRTLITDGKLLTCSGIKEVDIHIVGY